MKIAHRQRAAVLLQGFHRCVRVSYIHGVAPAVCMGQPQQQRVEALVEVLRGGHRCQSHLNFTSEGLGRM